MIAQIERRPDGAQILALQASKLDMSNAAEFKRAIAPHLKAGDRIVIDMTAVDFVDSSGLGAIISCLRDLSARGGDLALCAVQRRVNALFSLVRLQRIVGIFDTADEALARDASPS